MSFRGFQNQFNENSNKKMYDVNIQLRKDFLNKEELALRYIEDAKKLGSEEQLEQFIYDLVNTVYTLGFADSKADMAQYCAETMYEQTFIQTLEVEDEDYLPEGYCDCDDCNE